MTDTKTLKAVKNNVILYLYVISFFLQVIGKYLTVYVIMRFLF